MSDSLLTVAELEALLALGEAASGREGIWAVVVYEQPAHHAFSQRAGFYAAGPSAPSKDQAHADARFFEAASRHWRVVIRQALVQAKELADTTAARDKLQAFKLWCHAYLDQHGVPHHPPGTHGAEGCRIGDRMDWLMARLGDALAQVDGLRQCLRDLLRANQLGVTAEEYDRCYDLARELAKEPT